MQTGSSETFIGLKSGKTTYVPLQYRMEGAWLCFVNGGLENGRSAHWLARSMAPLCQPLQLGDIVKRSDKARQVSTNQLVKEHRRLHSGGRGGRDLLSSF